jgi:hypothetical protein
MKKDPISDRNPVNFGKIANVFCVGVKVMIFEPSRWEVENIRPLPSLSLSGYFVIGALELSGASSF